MKKAKTIVASALAALTIGSASLVAFAANNTGYAFVNNVRVDGSLNWANNKRAARAQTSATSAMNIINTTAILRYTKNGEQKSVSSVNNMTNARSSETTASTSSGEGYGATGIHEAEHNGDNKIFATYLSIT